MWEIPGGEKLLENPIMLKEDAPYFFHEYQDSCRKFEDALKMLHNWYNSTENGQNTRPM